MQGGDLDHSSHVASDKIDAGGADKSKLKEAKRKSIPQLLAFLCLLLAKRGSIAKGEK